MQILNDILDVSRLEARRIEFVEVPFLVRDLVSGVGDLLAPRAEAKGFEIVTHVAQGVPAVLSGDAGRLRQILINLVSNAVKFTQDGEVRLRLDLRAEARETGDGGRLWPICFSVEDTGPGVPVDQREQIFERFRTLVAPDGTRSEGVGSACPSAGSWLPEWAERSVSRSLPKAAVASWWTWSCLRATAR